MPNMHPWKQLEVPLPASPGTLSLLSLITSDTHYLRALEVHLPQYAKPHAQLCRQKQSQRL